jgi:DNA-binding GntR family transcriptional regulator
MLLEPPAVRMAAVEYNTESIETISRAIAAESAAADEPGPADFEHANEDFRRAVFGGISNKVLWGLISQFANHLSFIRAVTLRDIPLRHAIIAQQREIRDAIAARNESLAEGLWKSYLRYTEDAVLTAVDASGRHDPADPA